MTLDIILGVLALAFAVLAAFLVPALIQLKKTAIQLEAFLKSTEESLLPLLKELKETTGRANQVVGNVESQVAKVDTLFDAAERIGYTVEGINILLRQKVDALASSVSIFSAGMKGAFDYIASRRGQREKKQDTPAGPHYY